MEEHCNTMITSLEKLKNDVEELVHASSRMMDLARDPEMPKIEDASRKIIHLEEELRRLQNKNFDDLRTIARLEENLKKKEEEVVGVNCKLTKIEDELYDRDGEILEAKLRLSKVFPEVNGAEPHGERRLMGRLDIEDFRAACLLHKSSEAETEADTMNRAEELYQRWETTLMWFDESGIRPEAELTELRTNFGDNIYHSIRKVLQERAVAEKTDVYTKPWNIEYDREKNLSEILSEILLLLPDITRRRRTRRAD